MTERDDKLSNIFQSPNVWQMVLLEEIALIGAGNPAPQAKEYFKDGTTSFVRVQDMGRLQNSKYIVKTTDYINQRAVSKMRLFPAGTVLFTKSGASSLLNQRAILKSSMCVVSHIATAIPLKGVLSKYLYFWLKTVDFNYIAHATTLPSIPLSKVSRIKTPLASTEEQKQMVNDIEQLLSELDNAVDNLKKAREQLKVYRYAVLDKLISSKKIESLGNLIDQPKYGTAKKCKKDTSGLAVLRIPNIGNKYIDHSDLKYAEFTENEIDTYSIHVGDLLMIRSNGSVSLVGKTAIITKKDTDSLYAGYLIKLRPKDNLDSTYLYYSLSSPKLRNQIESKAKSTSGVHNINSGEIKSLQIPICSIDQQVNIVQEIEFRFSVCDKIEETIEEGLNQAEALCKSVLKHAFEGKLTEQWRKENPKLITGKNSAKALLEKIKVERESLKPKKKRKL